MRQQKALRDRWWGRKSGKLDRAGSPAAVLGPHVAAIEKLWDGRLTVKRPE